MNQRLACSPKQEGSYNVGVGDIRELVALLEEASDVPPKGLTGLLAVVLEVPWLPRALVCALEVPHKDLLQIRPTLEVPHKDIPSKSHYVGQKVFQPRSC